MNELLLVVLVCLSNITCLIVGVKVGQKANQRETFIPINVEKPKFPNPVEKVKSFKESQEIKKEQEAIEDMLYNIDVYDGTSLGQRDIRL